MFTSILGGRVAELCRYVTADVLWLKVESH